LGNENLNRMHKLQVLKDLSIASTALDIVPISQGSVWTFRVIWWSCGSVIGNRKREGYSVTKPIKRRNLTAVTFHNPVLWDTALWFPKLRGNYCLYFELGTQAEDEEKVSNFHNFVTLTKCKVKTPWRWCRCIETNMSAYDK